MPVIVVGADTEAGLAILEGLSEPNREIRAFVSDHKVAESLRSSGFKVALGDVSDGSHVEAASTACFSAVLIVEAATDDRQRSFASTRAQVLDAWASAVLASKVRRVLWVSADEPPSLQNEEVATVDPTDPNMVERIVALDDAQSMRVDPSI
ncbi:MAG: NAD-binding protein [Actinomycetota bacterium]|nr:NAD-binding protein [Actinomycetota bacterium]